MLAQTYLLLVAQELEENQRFAEQVAVNGFNLVHAALKPTHVLKYWYRLLVAYSELQTFTPQIHPDAYLLTQSILGETTLSRGIVTRKLCGRTNCALRHEGPVHSFMH